MQKLRAALLGLLLCGVSAGGTMAQADTFSVLHNFKGGADGRNPRDDLIHDEGGNLIGTTFGGGADDLGTVFKMTLGGSNHVLFSFNTNTGDVPISGVISDANGNFLGTTTRGAGDRCNH